MSIPTIGSETDVDRYAEPILEIIRELQSQPVGDGEPLVRILRRHTRDDGGIFSKNLLVRTYKHLCMLGKLEPDEQLLHRLRMKPSRTISGVAPVTVLTKPYPCPGKCIFCPTDIRMPKSYLPDEPGAMRAEQHSFDPFEQTAARVQTFSDNGHSVDKIELLILGGTWSSYEHDYQEWFVRRCFDAMNGRSSDSLDQAHRWNERAQHRNVGLVIETRPDHITPVEIRRLRTLGVTKVQLGAQSLQDNLLDVNARGHTVDDTRHAVKLLRAAGFKIVLHWMPNLLGATPESDRKDYSLLWSDFALRPDELKIYPCSLLADTELHNSWQLGDYHPYSDETLLDLVADCKLETPLYCRINRVYRDIPAPNIVAGSTLSNLRQVVQGRMRERGQHCQCMRCREVRGRGVSMDGLRQNKYSYRASASEEHFLSFDTRGKRLAGYARLSLPTVEVDLGIREILGAALLRELHVYGPAVEIGDGSMTGRTAQHRGLGTRLLERSESIAAKAGFDRIAVIAAVGTREYYRSRGFVDSGTYMVKSVA